MLTASRRTLLIGTRGSRLARIQAETVREMLSSLHPDRAWLLRGIRSEGDVQPNASLATIGGQGVFVKALEEKLAAVSHSDDWKWSLNKEDPAVKAAREKRQEEFKARYK